jgi:hypothetical protein
LRLYYKIANSTGAGSLLLSDISHNLSSAFTLYINKSTPNTIYIKNSNITSIANSSSLLPVAAFKEYAVSNPITQLTSVNPIITWNFNQTWGYGALPGLATVAPNQTGIDCYVVPSPEAGDITINGVRTLTTSPVVTGTNSTVTPGTLTVNPGTFIGDTVSIPVSYGALSSAAISSGTSEVPPGSNAYLNLANIYLTFSSDIC